MRKNFQPYIDVIRLWKDEEYRKEQLTSEELAQFDKECAQIQKGSAQIEKERIQFIENPAGIIDLTDAELRQALRVGATCSENASISTSWCDNPKWC